MDEQEPVVDMQLEEKIKQVIVKIKEKRSRPCYQNILTFINRDTRGNKKVELDYLVDVLKGMIDKNIIVNMGKEGKESFNLITDFNMESQDIENAITDSTDNLENQELSPKLKWLLTNTPY